MAASDAKMSKGSTEETDLVITRVFDAPRGLVFDAWTKAEHLQHWQGAPRGFTVTTEKSDIRPGRRLPDLYALTRRRRAPTGRLVSRDRPARAVGFHACMA